MQFQLFPPLAILAFVISAAAATPNSTTTIPSPATEAQCPISLQTSIGALSEPTSRQGRISLDRRAPTEVHVDGITSGPYLLAALEMEGSPFADATGSRCYPALSLKTSALPAATAGSHYNVALTVAGGQPPYSWSLGPSSLPHNFSVNSSGDLSGETSRAGTYTFNVIVSDTLKNNVTGALTLTVVSSTTTQPKPTPSPTPSPSPTPTPTPAPSPNPAPAPSGSPNWTPQFMAMNALKPSNWPTVPIGAMRPTGTTWATIEPSRGVYQWQGLDSWVAASQAHGVQLEYVFLNVPQWASTLPTQSCNRGPIGCAAPPNDADWKQFVTTLVTRYKGRITSYEMWNEADAYGFWTGTPAQMVHLASLAYPIIKSIDPNAIVLSPSDAAPGGWPIPYATWLDEYLQAGGGKYADAIAWHGYAADRNTQPASPPEVSLLSQIVTIRGVLAKYGLQTLPLWNTEGGYGADTQLPGQQQQADFLARWYLIQFGYGVARAYWYQWDNTLYGTLWTSTGGETPAGQVYGQISSLLSGARASGPCTASGAVWTCNYSIGAVSYEAVWDTAGTATFTTSGFTAYADLTGKQFQIAGNSVPIGPLPILLH